MSTSVQQANIGILEGIAGSFSIAGILFVLISWSIFKELREHIAFRLAVYICISDLFFSIAGILFYMEFTLGYSSLTFIESMLCYYSFYSGFLWTAVFAYSVYCIANEQTETITDNENLYIVASYGFPVFLTSISLLASENNSGFLFHGFNYDIPVYLMPYFSVLAFNCFCFFKAYQIFKVKNPTAIKQIVSEMLTYPSIFLLAWGGFCGGMIYHDITGNLPGESYMYFITFMMRFQGFLNAMAYGFTPSVRELIRSRVKNWNRKGITPYDGAQSMMSVKDESTASETNF